MDYRVNITFLLLSIKTEINLLWAHHTWYYTLYTELQKFTHKNWQAILHLDWI